MSLCYYFQKWTMLSLAAVAIALTVGLALHVIYGLSDDEDYYAKYKVKDGRLMCIRGDNVGFNNCFFTDNIKINQTGDRALRDVSKMTEGKYTVNSTLLDNQILLCLEPALCNIYNINEREQYQVLVEGNGGHVNILDYYIPPSHYHKYHYNYGK
jgi:hypothetical protein